MALLFHNVDDFVNLVLSRYKRKKWLDLSLEHTEYVASRVIASKGVKERGGPDIRWKVQTGYGKSARNTGLFAKDVTGVEDLSTEAVVTWTKQTNCWEYDIDESLFESDRETIVSVLEMREHGCHNSLAELAEENMWSAPSGTSDHRPFGIPFWLQKDATTTPGGAFNGGNPTGFSAGAASIDSTEVTRWKNFTFGYTTVTPGDLVKKIKFACYKTKFMAPHPHPELGFGKADYHIFTTYDVREGLEQIAESRNDNLGKDVARYINTVTVGGIPVESVPYLDANDTSDPLYGVNWKVMRPFVKRGCDMRRITKESALQHTVREVHYDTWMNWTCEDRRSCWVGSTS